MLKRLRRKLMAIVLALVGVVLACALGLTLYSSWVQQDQIVQESLEHAVEGELDSVPVIGGNAGRGPAQMLAVAVDVGADGVVLRTSQSNVVIYAGTLSQVVSDALDSDDDQGHIDELHVSWMRRETSGGWRIAVVDTSGAEESMQALAWRYVEVGLGALAVLAVVAWLLSGWALGPVQKAWDQQRRFVADASHELKTPLAVIVANTEILQAEKDLPAETRRWVDSTAGEARHMKGLVMDLLELARTDERASGGKAGANMADVDLSELVESAALEFDAVAFERGCTVEDDVEEGIHVKGDPEWLGRLVRILVDNAVKYAAEGSAVHVRLERLGQRQGQTARLAVNNQGTPIDPEDLPHVFERFYRSDKARTREDGPGGFGLGLAIAKGIAEVHGGTIAVTSTEAEGTTFTVTL